ncbi:hypothetical protein K2X05_00550 [bacterium]|nr:hypothetical protein [bacterium]
MLNKIKILFFTLVLFFNSVSIAGLSLSEKYIDTYIIHSYDNKNLILKEVSSPGKKWKLNKSYLLSKTFKVNDSIKLSKNFRSKMTPYK